MHVMYYMFLGEFRWCWRALPYWPLFYLDQLPYFLAQYSTTLGWLPNFFCYSRSWGRKQVVHRQKKRLGTNQISVRTFGVTNFLGRVSWGHKPNKPLTIANFKMHYKPRRPCPFGCRAPWSLVF
jgi:hypothetical protein